MALAVKTAAGREAIIEPLPTPMLASVWHDQHDVFARSHGFVCQG